MMKVLFMRAAFRILNLEMGQADEDTDGEKDGGC